MEMQSFYRSVTTQVALKAEKTQAFRQLLAWLHAAGFSPFSLRLCPEDVLHMYSAC